MLSLLKIVVCNFAIKRTNVERLGAVGEAEHRRGSDRFLLAIHAISPDQFRPNLAG